MTFRRGKKEAENVKHMNRLEGLCPICGARYYGWALMKSLEQKCSKCGSDLDISENGPVLRTHYSSYTAKTFKTRYRNIRELKREVKK
jgi:transcription initiation factor IIE alpha subunit